MKKLLFSLLSAALLSACTPAAEEIMPPVQYKQPINFHVNKNALLNWETGKQSSAIATPSYGGGLISALIIEHDREQNPGRYTYAYGKAQQAVFMTSFKNVLEQNHVFNQVALTTNPRDVKPQDTLITINFRSTSINNQVELTIVLDVDMTIKSNGKVFKRTYLVKGPARGLFSFDSFKDQQTYVSQQLMEKLIAGINQWHQSNL